MSSSATPTKMAAVAPPWRIRRVACGGLSDANKALKFCPCVSSLIQIFGGRYISPLPRANRPLSSKGLAMHIKTIIVDGFKSYATRTEIAGFDPEFNAITGLNGSGKSNILDAICFVLGISNLTQARRPPFTARGREGHARAQARERLEAERVSGAQRRVRKRVSPPGWRGRCVRGASTSSSTSRARPG